MKTLLLLGSILALVVLAGCSKEEEAAKPVTPPAGVSASQGGPGGAKGGAPQMQTRSSGAVSNQ
ncbi:MAG: hypothetical protein QM758_19115 [Armatimonas sp.]